MANLCQRILLLFGLLAVAGPAAGADGTETRDFQAASEAFNAGFYERAEAELNAFAQKNPASALLGQAYLLQAEARIKLTNYAGAIDLLKVHQGAAGALADQYIFWLAEALYLKGDLPAAAEAFARVVKEFPSFSRAIEAVIKECTARSRLADTNQWRIVASILSQTNGLFQNFARTNPANDLVLHGQLLLSETELALNDYAAAEGALVPLGKIPPNPAIDWQRQYLFCRIQSVQNRFDQSLACSSNLLTLANSTGQRSWQAESAAFQAGLLEKLNRLDEAIVVYQNNLADGLPPERQREALLKVMELCLARNKLPQAIQMVETFLAKYPGSAATDLALLTLSELRLRQHVSGAQPEAVSTNLPGTNFLQQATALLNDLIQRFPQSALRGKAELNLGWCLSLTGKLPESQAAFEAAIAHLPAGADQATAYFKLADVQMQQKNFTNAITNYRAVIDKFSTVPEVRTNFLEQALYQSVRAGIAAGNIAAATNDLATILKNFPAGTFADRALLLTGSEVGRRGDPARARQLFSEFAQTAPNAPLLPQVRLAIARTYEEQNDWTNAAAQYEGWLAVYTNHEARARAQYCCGYANFRAGRETAALTLFTNILAQYPSSEFAPLAQWWVADCYFSSGQYVEAERNYKILFLSTNWAPSELTFQAQMMAGRAAFRRQQGWAEARDYFSRLAGNTNCPTDIRAQAYFAYGDTLISQDSTNKVADYEEAIRVFDVIGRLFPGHRQAVLAMGQKANCLLQWAQYSHEYEPARAAYLQVITNALSDVSTRSAAKVGLGATLEQMARRKNGPEQTALLKEALDQYLDVFYRKLLRDGEQPDLFWTQRAGLDAGRLAESLKMWVQAKSVYEQMCDLLPVVRPRMEKNILRLQEQITHEKNG
jgi:TolA-binding protein